MELHYKKMGEGQPLIIIHGLFGSSDNWKTHGKELAKHYTVYLLDMRNHGRSPWSEEFSYSIMADDVHDFIQEHQLSNVILMGHSMGGKVAIQYAQSYSETLDKLIIVDMGLKEYPITHDTIIEGLQSIDIDQLESRRLANAQLKKYVPEDATRMFLLKNLYRKGKGVWGWRINLPVLKRELPEIVSASPRKKTAVQALFLSGGKSSYVLREDRPTILSVFPQAQFYVIEGVGHWIHAEAPAEFMEEIYHFLNS